MTRSVKDTTIAKLDECFVDIDSLVTDLIRQSNQAPARHCRLIVARAMVRYLVNRKRTTHLIADAEVRRPGHDRECRRLSCERKPYAVEVDEGPPMRARAVVIATGAEYRRLRLENLARFEGAGVYYGQRSLRRSCAPARRSS